MRGGDERNGACRRDAARELPGISAEVLGVDILGSGGYTLGGSAKDRPALWMIRDGERRAL